MIIKLTSILTILGVLFMMSSCGENTDGRLVITDKVIVDKFIGNGAQWDPYDEALSWGSQVSDEDWQTLFTRIDFMKPGFVRCIINSPFTYFIDQTTGYDKLRNNRSILKLLQYCTDNNITVLFGEYNPPRWSMKQDQKWIDMAVDYLNYLVVENKMSCIKYYNLFNEPDGSWASTNGNFEMWREMVERFTQKMKDYPGLSEKVTIGAPDAVIGYHNPASEYNSVGWVAQTAATIDSLVGLYDLHAYPGQHSVRSGAFAKELKKHKDVTPVGKSIVLGEAGYKYYDKEDSVLKAEYQKRCQNHPFTKGTDCNMLVYDYFYGLDMPLLCMNVINSGYSGMAIWMLDDAMHSAGDSGKAEDIKLWGFWNILGNEVFNDQSQEQIRPWFFSYALMCRYFQPGCTTIEVKMPQLDGFYAAANTKDGATTVAMVNFSNHDYTLTLDGLELDHAKEYLYQQDNLKVDENGLPLPSRENIKIKTVSLPKQSFLLITDNNY